MQSKTNRQNNYYPDLKMLAFALSLFTRRSSIHPDVNHAAKSLHSAWFYTKQQMLSKNSLYRKKGQLFHEIVFAKQLSFFSIVCYTACNHFCDTPSALASWFLLHPPLINLIRSMIDQLSNGNKLIPLGLGIRENGSKGFCCMHPIVVTQNNGPRMQPH